jgi:hypothetical protein
MDVHGMSCLPVFWNGITSDKIDVVFVRTDEYIDKETFIQNAVMPAIWEAFYEEADIGANLDRYNFWVAERMADFDVVTCDNGTGSCCDWNARKWNNDCTWGDFAVLLHQASCRDSSRGDVFSSEDFEHGTIIHELGHTLFDFGDEYDDNINGCDTNYHEVGFTKERSNIWWSEGRCKENTTYPTIGCETEFTPCDLGYHKGNPGPSIMEDSANCNASPFSSTLCEGWGNDAIRQVNHIHNEYSASVRSAAITQSQSESLISENPKAIVAGFWFDGTALQLQDVEILYGETPDRKIPYNGFKLSIKDSIGLALSEFTIRDPRIREYEYPAGATYNIATFEFSQVLQFFKKAVRLEISENESGVLLGEFDLAPYISTFCSQFPEDEDCQCADIEVCDSVDNNCDGLIDESGYIFSEFIRPINSDGSSIFKAGRTIPVKLALSTCSGAVASEAFLQIQVEKVAGEIIETGYFRYDEVDRHYIYNLRTKVLDVGTYKVTTIAENGQSASFRFSIR